MSRVLAILEVSQKQAYIFSSNKLQDNIENSDTIAYITSSPFIEKVVGDPRLYSEEANLVYAGGGHTILEFSSENQAKTVVARVTEYVLKALPYLEMFATIMPYQDGKTPGENVHDLTAKLESKKAERKASFHQRTFGVEKTDVNTGRAILRKGNEYPLNVPKRGNDVPDGFVATSKFEDLGGKASNFIAVVHIDGNAMGKRVDGLNSRAGMEDWDTYKSGMRRFSEGIAHNFMEAYHCMEQRVAELMEDETFERKLSLKKAEEERAFCFPVRRIISEGDDICFVANGQIGLECAAEFIRALVKLENPEDHEKYAACAGVALVHQKYPFYRAYELAEELCSNAKKFGAGLSKEGDGREVSCIDWHIEYGEVQDTLDETRRMYQTDDGKRLEMRPYVVSASEDILKKEPIRRYENFEKLLSKMTESENFYGRGLLKGLRPVLKQGETATQYYLQFHQAQTIARDAYQGIYKQVEYADTKVGSGEKLERKIFVKTEDGKERSILFDAIEAMDNCILMKENNR